MSGKRDRKRSVTTLLPGLSPAAVYESLFLVRDEYDPERYKQRARGLDAVWQHAGECEYFIFRDLFDWFGPEMVEAGWPDRSGETDKILQRARAEWTSLTTLPPLCDVEAWRAAAYVVGYSRKELRNLKLGKLAEELLAWARSKRANHSISEPPTEPLTNRAESVYQYIIAEGPVTGPKITKRTGIDQSTLTKEIVPELKRLRGIVNKPGAGYYSPKHYRPQ